MTGVDVLIYAPPANANDGGGSGRGETRLGKGEDRAHAGGPLWRAGRLLSMLDGIEDVSAAKRGGDALMRVVYDPSRTGPQAMLQVLERAGCQARLIGL